MKTHPYNLWMSTAGMPFFSCTYRPSLFSSLCPTSSTPLLHSMSLTFPKLIPSVSFSHTAFALAEAYIGESVSSYVLFYHIDNNWNVFPLQYLGSFHPVFPFDKGYFQYLRGWQNATHRFRIPTNLNR